MAYPTQSRLKDLLEYDPETGVFCWRESYGKRQLGERAGGIDKDGYVIIGVDYFHCRAHRLAFIYMTGKEPDELVDHIDGNGQNNAWRNLREATHAMNGENRHRTRSNKAHGTPLGVKRSLKRWTARIRVRGKEMHLGTFDTIAEASTAYLDAKRRLHGGCTL